MDFIFHIPTFNEFHCICGNFCFILCFKYEILNSLISVQQISDINLKKKATKMIWGKKSQKMVYASNLSSLAYFENKATV